MLKASFKKEAAHETSVENKVNMIGKELKHVQRQEHALENKEKILEGKENRLEAESHHPSGKMMNPLNGMLGEPHIIRIHSMDDSIMPPPPGIFGMLDSLMKDKIRTGPVQSHFGPFPLGSMLRPGPHPAMIKINMEEPEKTEKKEEPK